MVVMRRRKSGLMIRLIDVVFILLFCFISIAQVNAKRVDLPQSQEAEDEQTFDFTLTVEPRVVTYNQDSRELPPLDLVEERGAYIDGLAEWIEGHYQAWMEGRGDVPDQRLVQIRPVRDTYVQYTIDVWDACRRLGLDAAIVVEPVE